MQQHHAHTATCRPADEGDEHADLVTENAEPMTIRLELGQTRHDRQCQAVAEEEENGAQGMHGFKDAAKPVRLSPMAGRDRASGVHDLGGRTGFGPVPIDDLGPFHEPWQGRAFAVTQFSQAIAGFNTDAFRHGIEREQPDAYLRLDYWSKWVRNAERMLVEGGVLAPDAVDAELEHRAADGVISRTTDALPPQQRSSEAEPATSPRFSIGDRVRVRSKRTDGGHSRLPGYVEGRLGTVVMLNGGWIFPDTHAHGAGLDPQWVYAVDFVADDLWSDAGDHRVRVDLFEPYLEFS